jgi:streptogramin lyase
MERRRAARCGSAFLVLCGLATLAAACAKAPASPPTASAPAPVCSWYGDADDGTLYFGESAFWSAMRAAGGDPRAESRLPPGVQHVGRFDLASETMLAPLATPTGRGTWDVLVHPNGRVYFTSYFDDAGAIDPATGAAVRFAAAGHGLNELALLPDGRVLATRYGAMDGGGGGSLVLLDPAGAIQAEHLLAAAPGETIAAKSLAYDPVRRVVWINTDVLPDGAPTRHDARIVDLASGRELARFSEPELQFPQFGPDGHGWFAWLAGRRLVLQITEPGAATGPQAGRFLLLDGDFAAGVDFVQDLRVQRDGRVVVTRWSGRVHVVDPDDRIRTVELPRADGGVYYTAVAHGERVCATHCAGVRVECASLP